jgi:hypothetical protein
MLEGRFGDTSGRPYIEGRILIPRLQVSGDVSFMVDTGADKTVLMPLDADRLRVDYSLLSNTVNIVGIGGAVRNFVEAAHLVFAEPGLCLHIYNINLNVCAPSPDIETIPSLLGRDVLDHWTLTYDKPNNRLSAVVVHADFSQPIGPRLSD